MQSIRLVKLNPRPTVCKAINCDSYHKSMILVDISSAFRHYNHYRHWNYLGYKKYTTQLFKNHTLISSDTVQSKLYIPNDLVFDDPLSGNIVARRLSIWSKLLIKSSESSAKIFCHERSVDSIKIPRPKSIASETFIKSDNCYSTIESTTDALIAYVEEKLNLDKSNTNIINCRGILRKSIIKELDNVKKTQKLAKDINFSICNLNSAKPLSSTFIGSNITLGASNVPNDFGNINVIGTFPSYSTSTSTSKIPKEKKVVHAVVPLTNEDPYNKEHNDLLDIVKQRMEQQRQMQGSQKVVTLAITSNLVMMCGKMYAAYQSGSASMFSEALHSIADILNESLLMLGISRSLREPDELHPYGYVQERYAWALVSGVGIFFLGGGASIYRGISGLLSPASEMGDPTSAWVVLGASLLFEMVTLRYAYQHIKEAANEQGIKFKDYFFKGADPTAVQVFAEDCASVLGIAIAGTCLTLSTLWGMPVLDSIGSLMIGSLLICVAGFLIRRNISGLVETSMHTTKLQEIVALLEYDPVVKAVHNVKSLSVSPEEARFKADIQFDGMEITRRYITSQGPRFEEELGRLKTMNSDQERKEWFIKHGGRVVESIGAEVDRLEDNIRSKRPEVKHIDLESS